MKKQSMPGWIPLLIMAVLLLQSGCAAKIPASFPLSEKEKPFVLDQLRKFQNRDCPRSLDADVILEWQLYGKTEKIPGMLQLQYPAFLRYSVVDPLGRQLLILVSDGNRFTLVDNRKAKALTGRLDSEFWQGYVPDFISPTDYMNWLTGRLSGTVFEVQDIRRDRESAATAWLITGWRDGIRHHVLFHPELRRVNRHIVENAREEVLLDVSYRSYEEQDPDCPEPRLLRAEGSGINGTVLVHFEKILPESPIPEGVFYLTLPDHFAVKLVE